MHFVLRRINGKIELNSGLKMQIGLEGIDLIGLITNFTL